MHNCNFCGQVWSLWFIRVFVVPLCLAIFVCGVYPINTLSTHCSTIYVGTIVHCSTIIMWVQVYTVSSRGYQPTRA